MEGLGTIDLGKMVASSLILANKQTDSNVIIRKSTTI